MSQFLRGQVIDVTEQNKTFDYKKYRLDRSDKDFALTHGDKTLAEWPILLRGERVRTMAFLRCVNEKATHLIDHTANNAPLVTQYKFTPPVTVADQFGTATFNDYRLKLHAGVYVFSDHRTGTIFTDHDRSRIDAKVYEAMKAPPRPMMLPAPVQRPALPAPKIAGLLPAPQPKREPIIQLPAIVNQPFSRQVSFAFGACCVRHVVGFSYKF
jgi:hypothetical protein